jgi:hypothetical protein
MSESTARMTFNSLIKEIVAFIGPQPLGTTLQSALNDRYPAGGEHFASLLTACRDGVTEGWLCAREGGGIRYGRIIKPSAEFAGFSVDVVDMQDIAGPHHRHPNGEIDLILPLTPGAQFDGHGAGWLVYEPLSAHSPTVSKGRALVLYLLPQGAIEFTR